MGRKAIDDMRKSIEVKELTLWLRQENIPYVISGDGSVGVKGDLDYVSEFREWVTI